MTFYLVLIFVSSILMWIADIREQNNKSYRLYIFVSVFMLIVVAGIRGVSVGTDINSYQLPMFRVSQKSSGIKEFFVNVAYIDNEWGYAILVFIIEKITNSINWLFLIEECFVLIPMAIAVWKYKNKMSPAVLWMMYLFVFYISTYNTIRQQIAMSIFFLAHIDLEEHKYTNYIFLMIVAFLMHYTVVVGLVLDMIYIINISQLKSKKLVLGLISVGVIIFSTFYRTILTVLVSQFDFLPRRYLSSSSVLHRDVANFPITYTVMSLISIVILTIVKSNCLNTEDDVDYIGDNIDIRWLNWLIMLNFIRLMGTYLVSTAEYAGRLYWYIDMFWMIDFALGYRILKNNSFNRIAYSGVLVIIFSAYCIYLEGIMNYSGAIPYVIN